MIDSNQHLTFLRQGAGEDRERKGRREEVQGGEGGGGEEAARGGAEERPAQEGPAPEGEGAVLLNYCFLLSRSWISVSDLFRKL